MSISALTDLAVARDADVHQGRPHKRKVAKDTGAPEDSTQGYRDVLTKAIPTEVLAGYTAIVGTVIATIVVTKSNPHPAQLVALRWALYGGFLAFTLGAVVVAYRAKRVASKPRRFPSPEAASAVLAAAAWGLVMPGNPLVVHLSAQAATIATVVITVAGAGIVAAVGGVLTKPSKVGKKG